MVFRWINNCRLIYCIITCQSLTLYIHVTVLLEGSWGQPAVVVAVAIVVVAAAVVVSIPVVHAVSGE